MEEDTNVAVTVLEETGNAVGTTILQESEPFGVEA